MKQKIKRVINKTAIKEKIEELEFKQHGYSKIKGAYTSAKNIKIARREKKVYATVWLVNKESSEKHDNLEYPFSVFGLEA